MRKVGAADKDKELLWGADKGFLCTVKSKFKNHKKEILWVADKGDALLLQSYPLRAKTSTAWKWVINLATTLSWS